MAEVMLVLAPFVLLGVGVLFVAFSGGPGRARQAYLTGGGRGFRIVLVLLYLGLGIAVPAAVIAGREEAAGSGGPLASTQLPSELERGKELFLETCAGCHNLDAPNARGVTGPDLDSLAPLDEERVLNAIEIGGTGENRMPPGLLEGQDAEDVAAYVARVAGR
jgi:mono/diheme cytochrome c family protein